MSQIIIQCGIRPITFTDGFFTKHQLNDGEGMIPRIFKVEEMVNERKIEAKTLPSMSSSGGYTITLIVSFLNLIFILYKI